MKSKQIKDEKEPIITDEIPGYRDFLATSALSGAMAATGVPEEEQIEEYVTYIASFCYRMADAMLLEKYKKNTRH
jgi:hypothetical protein